MPDDPLKDRLFSLLKPQGQEHVLAFWDALDKAGREKLAKQIDRLNLTQIDQLYREGVEKIDWQSLAAKARPPQALRLTSAGADEIQQANQLGCQALRDGRVGVVLVAGGEGSRLKFPDPKGLFPIGPVSEHSLLQILIERLRAVTRRYDVDIPLLLMTSHATHERTVAFLDENDRFGLPSDQLHFFRQADMPAVDEKSGKLLMSARDSLAMSPDGHGGMLAALRKANLFDLLQQRGIEQLFYCQVDNPLTQLCDPLTIGYHLASGSEMTTQVVAKTGPKERTGNVVSIDGCTQIIEYSDMPKEFAAQRTEDDNLLLWAGNLAVHVLDVALLRRLADQAEALPLHRASKAVSHIDASGEPVKPKSPNAIKFERFIFDLLPHAKVASVVEVERRDAFAPVKNSEEDSQVDTPTTSRQLMIDQHRRWLEASGAQVQNDAAVEISPLYALDAEELADKIEPGQTIDEPTFFA